MIAGERYHASAEFDMQTMQRGLPQGGVGLRHDAASATGDRKDAAIERVLLAKHTEHLLIGLVPVFGAPSVCLPENVIPSAGASCATFQSYRPSRFFCLRVSGAVAPSASV